VDPSTGEIKLIPSMAELTGDVLVRCINDALDCEIYVDNDVKLATEGEQWRAPRELSSLVLIEWGERIGAGIVLNGQLHRGASNDAGDIGFLDLALEKTARTRRDGLGAFESWVGAAEVVELTRTLAARNGETALHRSLDGIHEPDALGIVISAVQRNEPAAVEAVSEIARRFAAGVAAVRALLDPELVIIGGPMARCGDLILDVIKTALAEQLLNQPELELSSLGDEAVLFGAIHHCITEVERRYFTAESLTESLTASTSA
jgi:predicted NBD/HSP70 family sugar kinase